MSKPKEPPQPPHHMVCGGSWDFAAWECLSAYRNWWEPNSRYNNQGFRITFAPASMAPDRVLGGGSWYNIAGLCRSAFGYRGRPDYSDIHLGFRICLVPNTHSTGRA